MEIQTSSLRAPYNPLKRARSLLLRLPVELVFEYWRAVLFDQKTKPLNILSKCLLLVPELSYSISIVTDDTERYKASAELPQTPLITGLDVFNQPDTSRGQRGARIVWRILVLFNCESAVRTGELSSSDGCQYARLLLNPSVDLANSFIHCNDSGHTEQLLLGLQKHKRASGKLRIEYVPITPETLQLQCRTELGSEPLSYQSYIQPPRPSSTFSYFDSSKWCQGVVDLRIHYPKSCIRAGTNECGYPGVSFTLETVTPQLHVSFKGSRLPLLECSYFRLFPTTILDFTDSLFTFSNLNWSLETPSGRAVCKHARQLGYLDQQELSYNGLTVRHLYFTQLFTKLHYYGLPSSCVMHSFLLKAEEFIWHRLSSTGPAFNRFRQAWTLSPALKRLVIFAELISFKTWGDLEMPSFHSMSSLDYLQLVALEGSTSTWNLCRVLFHSRSQLRLVKFLELLQLRSKTKLPIRPILHDWISIDWGKIAAIAPILEELVIGGYFTTFILPQFINSPSKVQFSLLTLLCFDVTPLNSPEASDEEGWYSIVIPEELFPRLERLYLKGALSIAAGLNFYPKLSVPKTCTRVDLSSVIRTRVILNNKEMVIPDIPIFADTFNSWLRTRVTGEYQYGGAATSTMKRLEEVDEALRPI